MVDSTLEPGALTYGECVLPGERGRRGADHDARLPSVARERQPLRASPDDGARGAARRRAAPLLVRFLFIPGTIGSITWLARNEDALAGSSAGLVVACVGDPGAVHYKRSRRGDAAIDRAAEHVLARLAARASPTSPHAARTSASTARRASTCPSGRSVASREGEFAEYHSSADDLALVRPEQLEDALDAVLEILDVFEAEHGT